MNKYSNIKSRIFKIILIIFMICIALFAVNITSFFLHLKKYSPDGNSEFHSPYYVYTSQKVKKKAQNKEKLHILVLPNNTGTISDDNRKHELFSMLMAFIGKTVFKELNVIILVPAFPRPADDETRLIYTHALDRDVFLTNISSLKRPDLQLLAMIDETRKHFIKDGWDVDERVIIWGFSASGMFTNRFTLLHPERVLGASTGSPGGWPIAPVSSYKNSELRYPIGISDIEALSGNSINMEAFKKVPQIFFIGEKDTNDSVPYRDSYEEQDRQLVYELFGRTPIERWTLAEKMYSDIDADARFKLYKGMGHIPSIKCLSDSVSFFKSILEKDTMRDDSSK